MGLKGRAVKRKIGAYHVRAHDGQQNVARHLETSSLFRELLFWVFVRMTEAARAIEEAGKIEVVVMSVGYRSKKNFYRHSSRGLV